MKQYLFLIFACLLVAGCRTKKELITETEVVPLTNSHVEYRDRAVLQHDSIFFHDSVFVKQAGDTVYIDRWHLRYKQRLQHDTVRVIQCDTIEKPVRITIQKPVKQPLKWYEKLLMALGIGSIGIGVYKLRRLWKW